MPPTHLPESRRAEPSHAGRVYGRRGLDRGALARCPRMSIPWTPGLGCAALHATGPAPRSCTRWAARTAAIRSRRPTRPTRRGGSPLPAGSLTDLGRTVTPLVGVPGDPVDPPEARVAQPHRLAQGPVPHDLRGHRPHRRRAGRVHHVHRQPRRLVRRARSAGKNPVRGAVDERAAASARSAAERPGSGGRPPRPGRTAPRRRGADRPWLVRGDVERSAPGGRVDAVRHRRLPPGGRRARGVARPAARRGQRAVRRRRHPRRPPPRARRCRGPGRRRARDAARLRADGRGRAGPLGGRGPSGRARRPALDCPLDRRQRHRPARHRRSVTGRRAGRRRRRRGSPTPPAPWREPASTSRRRRRSPWPGSGRRGATASSRRTRWRSPC